MAEEKRYYWLKLKEDFFNSKRIKKLRNMAGGDTYTIIYLKMQLLALKTEGILTWTGLEEKFADELALDLNEKPDDVAVTLMYLLNTGLAETQDDSNIFLPWVIENTGSETSAAERMRKMRGRNNVTPLLRECYTEKEIEKEINTDTEKEEADKPQRSKAFKPPTVEEVAAYCAERQNGIDAQAFVDFYAGTEWFRGKTKIKDWKACVRTWEKRDRESPPREKPKPKPKQYTTAAEYNGRDRKPISADALEDIKRSFGLK